MRAKPVRRIVCVDGRDGKSRAIEDGPAPDVRTDPARPGFFSTLIWATDATPARIDGAGKPACPPHALYPSPGGSLCRIVTFPPDRAFRGGVRAPHAGMQKTRTLDFCLVLEGEITLVLDTEEVELKAGDTVVQRGTRHAWSNGSDSPCVVAISSHDATY
jgi:mannose-6-phosphate isomerase-like protein (cupin superfamily)